jgi:arsenate reductase (thioredoxin)
MTSQDSRSTRMPRVLFICIRNSARSQMAEAFLKRACPGEVYVESAGLEPGVINPLAVAAMKEVGIDISKNSTQSVFDVFKASKLFSHVITVCDEASAAACPVFPGIVTRLNWNIPDPGTLAGTWDEQLEAVRPIRQAISDQVDGLCKNLCHLVSAS